MKRLASVLGMALAQVAVLALVGGDPRGTGSMARSEAIVLAALLACACTTGVAWRGAGAARLWLLPAGIVGVMGALSGWIAGAEIAGDPEAAVRLAVSPGRALFLVAMTVVGMALPPAGLVALVPFLARRTPPTRTVVE